MGLLLLPFQSRSMDGTLLHLRRRRTQFLHARLYRILAGRVSTALNSTNLWRGCGDLSRIAPLIPFLHLSTSVDKRLLLLFPLPDMPDEGRRNVTPTLCPHPPGLAYNTRAVNACGQYRAGCRGVWFALARAHRRLVPRVHCQPPPPPLPL